MHVVGASISDNRARTSCVVIARQPSAKHLASSASNVVRAYATPGCSGSVARASAVNQRCSVSSRTPGMPFASTSSARRIIASGSTAAPVQATTSERTRSGCRTARLLGPPSPPSRSRPGRARPGRWRLPRRRAIPSSVATAPAGAPRNRGTRGVVSTRSGSSTWSQHSAWRLIGVRRISVVSVVVGPHSYIADAVGRTRTSPKLSSRPFLHVEQHPAVEFPPRRRSGACCRSRSGV